MEDIKLTVAMPVWNSKEIAWLPMESLCNQLKPAFKWELIIAEEKHDNQCGRDYFESYEERLKDKNCERIKYLENEYWVPPSYKWCDMGKEASETSEAFLIQDADCYSFRRRISISHIYLYHNKYDWYDVRRSLFYHIPTGKMILMNKQKEKSTHTNMAFKTEYARTIPCIDKRRRLNNWLCDHCRSQSGSHFKRYIDEGLYNSLDTDGFNNISDRRKHFKKPRHPFEKTKHTLESTGLPDTVIRRLKEMRSDEYK